jgi:hypothetical protein
MQSRERILLLVVVGLLVLLGGAWGGTRVLDTLRKRRAELAGLEASAARVTLQRAKLSDLEARQARLTERSLPPQVETARTAYGEWLTHLVNHDEVKFAEVEVTQLKETPERGFTRLPFQVKGQATYRQLVRFLEKFYSADHLHKITELHLPVSRDSRDAKVLNVTVMIEALALATSKNKDALSKHPSADNSPEELKAAAHQLLQRHFYRVNQAPEVSLSKTSFTVGNPVKIQVNGSDPDGDGVDKYRLVEGPPWLKQEGKELVSTSNPSVGTYKLAVEVTDAGVPPKSTTKEFTLSVKAEQVPVRSKPEIRKPFDHLSQTFFERLLSRDGEPEAMIKVRTLGTRHALHVGDEVQVDSVKIKVLSIDPENETLEIQLPDGKRRKARLGKSLAAP